LAAHRDATDPPLPLKQPFAMEPEPDRPRATPPLSTSSPPLTTLNRLHPSSPSSPERQEAGLQHRDDVAVEAMDRAALLPLPQVIPLLVTTSSPPCSEREVSTEPFTLMWTRPSSRGWTEPCELAVCVSPAVPHRAAAQTRRRLRAGHRAEPVVLQVPLPSSPRALPCLAIVSYPCSDERTPSSGSPSTPTH
jgi:hypothetical protein